MIQLFCLLLLSIVTGIILCLAAATDPHPTPNQQRRRLFPIGVCLVITPTSLIVGAALGLRIGEIGVSLTGSLPELLPAIGGLAGAGVGGLIGLVASVWLGHVKNRRFWMNEESSNTPESKAHEQTD